MGIERQAQRMTADSGSEAGGVTPDVLIIERDRAAVQVLMKLLAARGIRGTVASEAQTAERLTARGGWSLVFLAEPVAGGGGREFSFKVVEGVRSRWPELAVVMMGEDGSVSAGVEAVQAGCVDYMVKPLQEDVVGRVIERYVPNHRVAVAASGGDGGCGYEIVGSSEAIVRTVQLAGKVAATSVPVLIAGESGTGKELFAALIHNESRRVGGPYIRVNCTALSDSLLESELFGHEKGAFTGAYARRKGRFEGADGGTVLLDEITETGPRFQSQLLRVLEQQDFERVGGSESIRVNVRVISTTNRDILEEVRRGRFRMDLYYRLAGVRLVVPPLRKRKEDLEPLVWHFVNQFAGESGRRIKRLDAGMMEVFEGYDWPGNVRQLRNVVRSCLVLGEGEVLSLSDVSGPGEQIEQGGGEAEQTGCGTFRYRRGGDGREVTVSGPEPVYAEAGGTGEVPLERVDLAGRRLDEIERRAILATLERTSGNQAKAARVLGISDRTLREKVRRYRRAGCAV